MYHVSAQGVDERMINIHYYYYLEEHVVQPESQPATETVGSCFVSLSELTVHKF